MVNCHVVSVLMSADSAIDTHKHDGDPVFVRLRNPSTGLIVSLYTLV